MLFKYPQLLWALFLLLIPILIHLFQLRKFKKTPFTNVKILKKVVVESRKSNSLKKWLLLCTRLLLLSALIIAFCQPYIPGKTTLKDNEIIIYLDNSLSMQYRDGTSTLLENNVQELLKSIPEDAIFKLFTNDKIYKEATKGAIKNDLLTLPYSSNQLQLDEIYLKAASLFSKDTMVRKELVLISDFQKRMFSSKSDTLLNINTHFSQSTPNNPINISIDTLYISTLTSENIVLKSVLSATKKIANTAVLLYNGDKLIAQTSVTFDDTKKGEAIFTLPANDAIQGKVLITDSGLSYDNELYFNIDKKEKIKVLSIGNAPINYLSRIFTNDVFQHTNYNLNTLNYSQLPSQNLIILNELNTIPIALQNALQLYKNAGGSLAIIPGNQINLDHYNTFLPKISKTKFISPILVKQKITEIAFSHPLFKNVFEKKVSNFQYPSTQSNYSISSNMPQILSYQSGTPFLVGENGTYIFTASISKENSNIINSPLIVPTFFNIGMGSMQLPEIYEMVGSNVILDIPIHLSKNTILKVTNEASEFIPLQQSFAHKTTISFNDYPTTAGVYQIKEGKKTIKNISFNFPRDESQLNYMNLTDLQGVTNNGSISNLFQNIEKDNSINELWKWFVILALLFIFTEVLILKFLK